MFLLDQPSGHAVGATTFSLNIEKPISIGSGKLATDKNQPALVLNKVIFTAYYPAQVSPGARNGVHWLLRPTKNVWLAYAHMLGGYKLLLWPFVYLYGRFLKIPAYHKAPPLDPPSSGGWPLVIFSHGLFGSRTAYSQLCTRLAAAGNVVLAVEHRDGTGNMSFDPETNQTIQYLTASDVVYEPPSEGDKMLRGDQLTFRRHELYEVYRAFSQFVAKDAPSTLQDYNGAHLQRAMWANKVDTKSLALCGHSFGGATLFTVLASAPPAGHSKLNVSRVIALDPWVDTMPSPGPVPESHCFLPLLCINSEPFTLWTEHHERIKSLISEWYGPDANLVTLARSQHLDFSDYTIATLFLGVFGGKLPRLIMKNIETLCVAYLDNELDKTFCHLPTKTKVIEKVPGKKNKWGEPKRQIVGDPGDVILEP